PNLEAEGVKIALNLGIAVKKDYRELLNRKDLDLVMNLTGLPEITEALSTSLTDIEVVGGNSARIFWELIEKQKQHKAEINKNLMEHQAIYQIGLMLASASKLSEIFETVVRSAAELTDSPAGSLAIYDEKNNVMQMVTAIGLSDKFSAVDHWEVRKHGLTRRIIDSVDPVVIPDVKRLKDIDNPVLLREGIKSVMAVALMTNEQIVGILYVDDFHVREYAEREVSVLKTFAVKAALAIEKMKLLDKLEQTNRDLQKANRLKSDFLANMSHELRTPLNSIIGFSELLIDQIPGKINQEQKQCLEDIFSSGKHLLNLINEVLDISKIEAGKFELCYGYFSFPDLIEEIIRTVNPLITQKGQNLLINLDKAVKEVYADRVKLKQIVLNLISNAVKFTPTGGDIEICSEPENGGMILSVKDTGVGIDEADFSLIFDEFRQVDQSSTRKYEGTGLGLALTKRLVEMHKGRIWLESEPGKGSKFSFFIPGKRKIKEVEKKRETGLSVPVSVGSGNNILIIEDDPKAANILHYYLTNQGYEVLLASDGREGLKLAKEEKPLLIVLDIMLPGKDGWEVLNELRKNKNTSDIPVIVTSIVENKDLAFSFGVLDYFVKPTDKNLLLERISNISRVKNLMARHILLICGNHQDIHEISTLLIAREFEILKACSAEDGLRLADKLKPDLIMLDLSRSIKSGLGLIKQLRKRPNTKDIPILALTTDELDGDARHRIKDLMIHLINKTLITDEDLFKEVEKHLP
ncbi:MAG: response regulator, partial [bacterium]